MDDGCLETFFKRQVKRKIKFGRVEFSIVWIEDIRINVKYTSFYFIYNNFDYGWASREAGFTMILPLEFFTIARTMLKKKGFVLK